MIQGNRFRKTYVLDILASSLVGAGRVPDDTLVASERLLEVLNTSNDGLDVVVVLQVGDGRDDGVEGAGDGHAAAGDGTTAKVLAHRDGLCFLVRLYVSSHCGW